MKKQFIIAASIIIGLIVLDQITKLVMLNHYGGRELLTLCHETSQVCRIESITIIPGLLSFTFNFNQGGAWGLLYGEMMVFYVITLGAFVLFYFLLQDIDFNKKKIYTYGIVLMIAGAIGNFIDRLFFQKVTDFIRFDFIDFPIFNIADICLVIGVILFALDILLEDVIKWKK